MMKLKSWVGLLLLAPLLSFSQESPLKPLQKLLVHKTDGKITEIQFPFGGRITYSWKEGRIDSKTYTGFTSSTAQGTVIYPRLDHSPTDAEKLAMRTLEMSVLEESMLPIYAISPLENQIEAYFTPEIAQQFIEAHTEGFGKSVADHLKTLQVSLRGRFLYYWFLLDLISSSPMKVAVSSIPKPPQQILPLEYALKKEIDPALHILALQFQKFTSIADEMGRMDTVDIASTEGPEKSRLLSLIQELSECAPVAAHVMTTRLIDQKVARMMRGNSPTTLKHFQNLIETDTSYAVGNRATFGIEMVAIRGLDEGRNELASVEGKISTRPDFLGTYFADPTFDIHSISTDPEKWSLLVLAHEFGHTTQLLNPEATKRDAGVTLLGYLRRVQTKVDWKPVLNQLKIQFETPYVQAIESSATLFAMDELAGCF